MHFSHNEAALASRSNDASGRNLDLAMGALLADMNHDIRTSMNGILGMLELLRDTGLTPSQQHYTRIAQHNVDTLLELLERVVDLSLIESKQFHLADAPFDLLQEMQAACSGKDAAARKKGLHLTLAYPPALLLHGDAARLREVVSGLVDIALRFASGGSIATKMEASCGATGRCALKLSVHATCLSAEGERLASMLNQPAERGIAMLSVHGKSALELALCAQLAKLLGGRINVERCVPNGTLFCFSLDLPFTAHPLSGGRGLIIAERADEWKPMFTPFIPHDIHIDTCDSPMTGLAAIAQAVANRTPYRFILLGRQIQGMDASVLAAAIKGDPACRETQLVLLSEQPKEDPVQCASTGFAACISRSADPAAAASTLTRLWSAAAASGRAVPFLSTSSMEATQPGEGTPMPFAGYRVLVADDNPVNQEIAVHLLEKLGCKSDAASDGMQAVDMHRDQAYDLILMDCNMPGLDGFQATQRIRMAESSTCRTPIVALTACTSQEEREQCLAAGMDDFLAKPIRPQTLKEMLARWLPPLVAAPVTPVGCDDELEAIQEMFGAGFSELASLYQNDTPPRITALRDGYAAGDCVRIAKVAHALSGSSASIGATGLSALCKELESRAKAGSLEEFEHRMAAIEAEYRRLSSKLQSMLTS